MTDTDDPIRRVLAHIDRAIEWTELRRDILTEVRDLLRQAAGEGQPDGWLQVGTRPDE